jgi:small subunit ribosomal protein S4
MARYIGPKCKLARREGKDLFLKSGVRALESKCKSDVAPGQHGSRRAKITDFGTQLRAKQRLKRIYGLLENQFKKYYTKAAKTKGSTGEVILQNLECRLDNAVYRLGLASTRSEARQLVGHKSILVNGNVVNIPSYKLLVNDIVSVREKAKKQQRIAASIELSQQKEDVDWMSFNKSEMSGKLIRLPEEADLPSDYNIQLVVELYSK